jgi:hypothetical protein
MGNPNNPMTADESSAALRSGIISNIDDTTGSCATRHINMAASLDGQDQRNRVIASPAAISFSLLQEQCLRNPTDQQTALQV